MIFAAAGRPGLGSVTLSVLFMAHAAVSGEVGNSVHHHECDEDDVVHHEAFVNLTMTTTTTAVHWDSQADWSGSLVCTEPFH